MAFVYGTAFEPTLTGMLRPLARAARMAAYQFQQRRRRPLRPVPGVRFDRDVPVAMRDGVHLMANVFHPQQAGRYPVVLSVSPYGKDLLPEDYGLFRALGVDVGSIHTTDYAAFEAPDPGFWVPRGYAVVHANVRGMWNSEGHATWLSPQDAEDYFDLIEWVAAQPWSTGRVGLSGVSYLAMSQWAVAALNPPHLAAIMPWEGLSDMYRELAFHGGMRETGFVPAFYRQRVRSHHNPAFPLGEDFLEQIQRHPLDDDYWASKRPELARITVPALVCASWPDQGLHTRGSLEGFMRISSEHKWLFTHGRRKWETYYSPEAQRLQQQFFDYFLRGIDTGIVEAPRVRLEVRRAYYTQVVRGESAWPVPDTTTRRLYLDARRGQLSEGPVSQEASLVYMASERARDQNRATFVMRFDRDTELTGGMRLRLRIATEGSDDADLFVGIEKLSPAGTVVGFLGYNFVTDDVVAKGWLRLSHRELDEMRSTETQPWHTHRRLQKLQPGEVVSADIEILSSSTLFEAGSSLRLIVQGHELRDYPAFGHTDTVNHGRHRLFTGGRYDAFLAVPLVERSQ
jgi:predicted acyl esterase